MAPRAIISYDDTPGDHDALMLGRILADAGASLTLAYVRHCTQSELLAGGARGARGRDAARARRRMVLGSPCRRAHRGEPVHRRRDCVGWPSRRRPTSSCSARTTGPRRDTSLRSARRRPCSRAGRPRSRSRPPATTASGHPGFTGSGCSRSPETTRRSPPPARSPTASARRSRATSPTSTCWSSGRAWRPPPGHVLISAHAQNVIENATCPVLVVPHGVTLDFPAVLAHAA